jgi:hypothetical protein
VNTIEERLRDAFDADAQTVRRESLRPPPGRDVRRPVPARGLRRGGLLMPLAAAAAVAATILGLAIVVPMVFPGGPAGRSHHHRQHLPPIGPPGSFLTVTTSPPVIHGLHLVRYGVSTLQVRSVRHGGGPTATLLRSLGSIDAVVAPDGSVIAVVDHGCRSQVVRIDARTADRTLIRTLPESAGSIALSPDGRTLSYMTYPASDPKPCGPVRQPASPIRIQWNPGGPAQFLPSVLAVVNLATGATVRAASPNPGNPPFSPSWSPDGTTIAVVRSNSVQLVSAAHPDFATARQLRPPHGCGYVASTWTASGILAVLGCGKQVAALSPRSLVRLPDARVRGARSWRLPACIDGVDLATDPTARRVLVQTDIGYGNGSCGLHQLGGWTTRVTTIRGARLATIAIYRQGPTQLQVTGW